MENPYVTSSSLVLKEAMLDAAYRSLLSKNLTTTSTQFNAVLGGGADGNGSPSAENITATLDDDPNATGVPSSSTTATAAPKATGGGIRGAYVIKTTIKTPAVLLGDVNAESSLGLTAIDALAALFPPTPVDPSGSPFDPSAGAGGSASAAADDTGATSFDENGNPSNTLSAAGGKYVSVARIDHADRMDVINLQERVLQLLEEGKAKPVGICPVREGVYDQAFDELIRQIAVLCPERGLLLSELRKEMRESDTTYDLLFDTACQYAVRKAISRDLGRTMLQEMEDISAEVRTAENRVSELRAKYEGQQKRAVETRAAAQKVHDEEVAFIKKGTQQLTQEIKRLTAQAQAQQQQK